MTSGRASDKAVDVMTAYATAAALYGNEQRLGVITTLTIAEYGMREENYNEQCGNVVVIPCVHHKTGAQGLAYLVITKGTDDIIEYYLQHIRQAIAPKDACKNFLFLTRSGEEYIHVYRKIKKYWQLSPWCRLHQDSITF